MRTEYLIAEIVVEIALCLYVHWQDFWCTDVELSFMDVMQIWLGFKNEPIRCRCRDEIIMRILKAFTHGLSLGDKARTMFLLCSRNKNKIDVALTTRTNLENMFLEQKSCTIYLAGTTRTNNEAGMWKYPNVALELLFAVWMYFFPKILVVVLYTFSKLVAAGTRMAARSLGFVTWVFAAGEISSDVYCLFGIAKRCRNYLKNKIPGKEDGGRKECQIYGYKLYQTTLMKNGKLVTLFLVDQVHENRIDIYMKCPEVGKYQHVAVLDP